MTPETKTITERILREIREASEPNHMTEEESYEFLEEIWTTVAGWGSNLLDDDLNVKK